MANKDRNLIGAAILAAGASRRMGSAKALLPLDSTPLIQHLIRTFRTCGDIAHLVVVTGHARQQIEAALHDDAIEFHHNPDHEVGGMLSSAKIGISALAGKCPAILIALLDQPLVQAATISTLATRWRQARAPLVLPSYNGKRGHPILIASACAHEILSLPATATLRDFVAQHQGDAEVVPVADSGVLGALDTPQDFENLKEQWRSLSCRTEQD